MASVARSFRPLLPAILALSSLIPFFCHHVSAAQPPPIAARPTPGASYSTADSLFPQIEDLKLKVSRLETELEETKQQINAKTLHAGKCDMRIEELTNKINDLQTFLSNSKSASLDDERIIALEEEVRVLWDASRKNNFLLNMLESKVEDAEEQLESITSEAEKLSGIVTELWIQIQQLEQALQITEMRTIELYRQRRSARCIFFKVVNRISKELYHIMHFFDLYAQEGSFWSFFTSEARNKIDWFFRAMKKYHYQLQGFVRRQMERYDLTSSLANEEMVFFLASALVVFPLMGAWCWLSST
ncbi:hypothetical protein Dimus_032711 [Dionaea muscipula]